MMNGKRKVVYFGNKISKYRKANAALETLEPLFADFCDIKTYSNVENKSLRILDMISGFFKDGLKADLILIDVFSTSNFYFAFTLSSLCILFRKKYSLVLRGGNLPHRYKTSKSLADRILKNARNIIAPSHYLKTFFESEGFEVVYLPNIIDLGLYEFKTRRSIAPNLLNIRGFGKPYNPQMTVRAIKLLKENYPAVKLAMLGSDYGDGTLVDTKKLIGELGVEKNIDIVGKMTRNEWGSFSKGFDIMVSNPVIDNTPVSVIEGMALGILIISTDVGGISYLLKDGEDALLVPSNDHVKLAEAIERLLDNPELCSLLQTNARKKAATFSWESRKPEWVRIINS